MNLGKLEKLKSEFPIGSKVEIKPELREIVFCSYGNGPFEVIGYPDPRKMGSGILDSIAFGRVEIKTGNSQRYFLDPNHIRLVD